MCPNSCLSQTNKRQHRDFWFLALGLGSLALRYLEGWGRTVICGRARLGGIPMGVIAVETRSVERLVPADPSNAESCEVKETMGGGALRLRGSLPT